MHVVAVRAADNLATVDGRGTLSGSIVIRKSLQALKPTDMSRDGQRQALTRGPEDATQRPSSNRLFDAGCFQTGAETHLYNSISTEQLDVDSLDQHDHSL